MITAPHSPLNKVLSLVSETSWKLETEVLFWTGFFSFFLFFSRTMDGGGEGGAGSEFSQEP